MKSLYFALLTLMPLSACKPALPSNQEAISIAGKVFGLGGRANCKNQKLISAKAKDDSIETSWICVDDLGQKVSVLVYVGRFGEADVMRMGVDDMGPGEEAIFIDVERKNMTLEKRSK